MTATIRDLEPLWDFSAPIRPPLTHPHPYFWSDEQLRRELRVNYRHFLQICPRIDCSDGSSRTWREIADLTGTSFHPSLNFWEAIGLPTPRDYRDAPDWFSEPYCRDIETNMWLSLRPILGLPDQGIYDADFVSTEVDLMTGEATFPIPDAGQVCRTTPSGYRYFGGQCIGETADPIFGDSNGSSCCWRAESWLLFADGLSHLILCLNSGEKYSSILETTEIECYPL